MGQKGEKAKALFEQGYNCAQAVFGAFCEETGFDLETAALLASPFGGGMGRLREVCGTVSGMLMAAGMLYGYSAPDAFQEKKDTYQTAQALANAFKDKNGSIICRELLGMAQVAPETRPEPEKRTERYYKKRPCALLAQDAADLLEDYIKSHPSKERFAQRDV